MRFVRRWRGRRHPPTRVATHPARPVPKQAVVRHEAGDAGVRRCRERQFVLFRLPGRGHQQYVLRPRAANVGSTRSCGSTFSVRCATSTRVESDDSTSCHHDGSGSSRARGRVSSPTNTTLVGRSERGNSSSSCRRETEDHRRKVAARSCSSKVGRHMTVERHHGEHHIGHVRSDHGAPPRNSPSAGTGTEWVKSLARSRRRPGSTGMGTGGSLVDGAARQRVTNST